MSTPLLRNLLTALKADEGWSAEAYIDTTGNITIGYGYNLAKINVAPGVHVYLTPVNGISGTIGESLLLGKLMETIEHVRAALPWFDTLDIIRQEVIGNMAYNLGVPGLLKWPVFLGQVSRGEYLAAALNMESTRWYRQVGGRGRRLAAMMRGGRAITPVPAIRQMTLEFTGRAKR